MTPSTPSGRPAWPTTKTGKRLAGCPGSLPLGGEQERLPDGSLTELRSMRTHEIAAAIEREAVEAYRLDLAEKVRGMEKVAVYGITAAAYWEVLRLIEGKKTP